MSLAEEVPELRDRAFSSLFSHALRGVPCRVLGLDGGPTELPVHEWTRAADPHDDALLAECVGDTLDVGCGPGRLAQRLAERRDRRVLGIAVVPEAVAQTRARGVAALQGSVFDPLPREGRWHTALLADGNVGIGGDPLALLARLGEVLAPDGRAGGALDHPGGAPGAGRHDQPTLQVVGGRCRRRPRPGPGDRLGRHDPRTVRTSAVAGRPGAAAVSLLPAVRRAPRETSHLRSAAVAARAFGEEDAVLSDALNHASIIDGIRLCKARRLRYANNDMADLEAKLAESKDCRFRLIATDGVFSMDGFIANLGAICDLADKYEAMVMVDDSHAVGFMGVQGRGTHEYCEVMERVDIITGTLGKALGGASGGYTSGRQEIIDLLRQRSRPYLFSNTLAPSIVSAALKALEIVSASTQLRDRLEENTRYFRQRMAETGFEIAPGEHPIVPIMLGDAVLAQNMAARMLEKGVYVIGFFYPVVPQGAARIRTQISAAHTREDLDFAVQMFTEVKAEMD